MTFSVRKSILGVTGIVLVSKLLGFAREMVIANHFGTSASYDLYLLAIMLPALFAGIFGFAGTYFLVPFLSKHLKSNDGDSQSPVWPVAIRFLLTAVGVVVLINLLAPYVMKIWLSSYGPEQLQQVLFYTRVTSLIVFLSATEAFQRSWLNVRRIFAYPAASLIVFNIFAIGGIVLWHEQLSVGAVALGLVGGLALQNIYLLIRSTGLRIFDQFSVRLSPEMKEGLMTTAGFVVTVELINRSYFMIDRYFAPAFGDGVISALNYSQVLVQLPDAVIGFAIGSVLFPLFSEQSASNDNASFGRLYSRAIISTLLLAVPIASYFFVNAPDLISILFQHGLFDQESVRLTTLIFRPLIPSIIALFLISTSIRACYASGWAKALFVASSCMIVIKLLATWLLSNSFGAGGISAATSLAHVGFAFVMLVLVSKRKKIENLGQFAFTILKIFVAGSCAGLLTAWGQPFSRMWFSGVDFWGMISRLGISLVILSVSFVMLAFLFGLGKQLMSVTRLGRTDN